MGERGLTDCPSQPASSRLPVLTRYSHLGQYSAAADGSAYHKKRQERVTAYEEAEQRYLEDLLAVHNVSALPRAISDRKLTFLRKGVTGSQCFRLPSAVALINGSIRRISAFGFLGKSDRLPGPSAVRFQPRAG